MIDLNHPLGRMLAAAAEGRFPSKDGLVEVVAPAHPACLGIEVVVEFTAHAVVATAVDRAAVAAREPDGYGGAHQPDFLRWLAGPRGSVGSHDCVLVRRGTGNATLAARPDLVEHPRVQHARKLRSDVTVHADERGLVTTGRGLAGRVEVSVELAEGRPRGQGDGRALIAQAVGLVPEGEWAFAEVSPGNAASLRAFLAIGFVPLGAEVVLWPQR